MHSVGGQLHGGGFGRLTNPTSSRRPALQQLHKGQRDSYLVQARRARAKTPKEVPASASAPSVSRGSKASPTSNSSNGTAHQDTIKTKIQLRYQTTWDKAWAHGSVNGGPWQDYELNKVSSAPGRWLAGSIDVGSTPASGGAPAFEFVVKSARNEWDKAADGANYRISKPGSHILRNGRLEVSTAKPVMVVSDLDGTMVGDDAATGTFRAWWEAEGVARGGVLVYNTGRALQSFLQLLREKGHCLAHPDALISAVGTKVYECDSGKWKEDFTYSALLNENWDLALVREAGYRTLASVGKDHMHFRPPYEQDVHKLTVGVAIGVLPQVLRSLADGLSSSGVKANIITSGAGNWRFVDIVPLKAGKLEALNYVRQHYGFPVGSTVACGDSGNDILMLSGANPAIVVGNAQPDLKSWLDSRKNEPPQEGGKKRLLQTEKHEAYGILEGLEYFGFK